MTTEKLKHFEGTLNQFLLALDSLKKMDTKKCLWRVYDTSELEPKIALYHDKIRVADSATYPVPREDETKNRLLIPSAGYRFLEVLRRKHKDFGPISIAQLEDIEGPDWDSVANGNITGLIGRYVSGFEDLGIVKKHGTCRRGYARWEPITTKGFNVKFLAQ